jgi:FkbH-like protein
LRRGLWLDAYTGTYAQYLQELTDPTSPLHRFAPDTALFSFDYQSLLGRAGVGLDASGADRVVGEAIERLRGLWSLAKDAGCGQIIQQTVIPTAPSLIGSNEHRLPGSPRALVDRINHRLRDVADMDGVDILALDALLIEDGIDAWHNPALWHGAKQEISPVAAPRYGDLVARMLAAKRGLSAKCLVLDLDNTLWGGVIGDDGLDGIVLGQGSALGEAYLSFQTYVRELARRGIILAVCSKNDEQVAMAPFEKHPEMVLRLSDIACFVANWDDKASNIRRIAATLNIGIDSLVFADDNPFERNLIRREIPAVAVPELPADPALYARCLADAGYFEANRLTQNDLERSEQYQANLKREVMRASVTDLTQYLRSLTMRLEWKRFDSVGLQRITQLINKTNQFNLTTRRYNETEVAAKMKDPALLALQLRLTDRYGDNGIISIVIAQPSNGRTSEYLIDTWLMSCRVLGRQVEEATMNLVASLSREMGATSLIGEFRPTPKNSMVSGHYERLGFFCIDKSPGDNTYWRLSLSEFSPFNTCIELVEAI